MAVSSGRRPVMTIYSGDMCPYSHRARIVLTEKNISAEIIGMADGHLPEDLMELNPYNSLPTLVDRDLVLYSSRIIMEYLDERYPHPPLMPVDPVARAQSRLFLYRVERDWYSLLDDLSGRDQTRADKARKVLKDGLMAVSPIFDQKPFFMSTDFSMIDCSLAPILWRLPVYGIDLPAQAKPLLKYADRIFSRDAFQASLSNAERLIRS
ncbi:glutathione S-transferase N-terminal domain-containing protein [Pseudomonadota bacterium]